MAEGLFAGIGNQIKPQAQQLNLTIANTGVMLHHRLELIEKHLSDLKRPSVGDKYFRLRILGTFKAEKTVLATVPVNEIWPIQYFATPGGKEKTPAFNIEFNGVPMICLNKEGTGSESPGGDLAALEGEQIEVNPEAEGKFNAVIVAVRVRLPTDQIVANPGAGNGKGRLIGRNTHDPARDIIGSATGVYDPAANELLHAGTDEFNAGETG